MDFIENKITRNFFAQRTLIVAKNLLGKYLVRNYKGKILVGKIVETEAYIGPKDKASHCYTKKIQKESLKKKILERNFKGIENFVDDREGFFEKILKCKFCKITDRNLAEYLRGGHIYIYLIYGIHYQLNITTYKEGFPECVLIRSLEPILNLNYPKGPGRVCKELYLDKKFWGYDLVERKDVWLAEGKDTQNFKIIKKKRIGIDYAEEYIHKLWRFYIKDNNWVSIK